MHISRGFKQLEKVDSALSLFLNSLRKRELDTEIVHVEESINRVLAEDVISDVDVPSFDRAAMDGYAVRAEDTYGASPSSPVVLKLVGTVHPGRKPDLSIGKFEAAWITTGSYLPDGADAVVMAEDAKRLGDEVEIYSSVPPWKNVDRAGEDIRKGDIILKKGTFLGPYEIAALCSINLSRVKVYRRVKVGMIATGDELVEVGDAAVAGKVVNSSAPMLRLLMRDLPVEVKYYGIVRDEPSHLVPVLRKSIAENDMVLTIAGTSIGDRDLLFRAVEEVEGRIIVHGVTQMPGRPTLLAISADGKPIIGLPGYPVATAISFMNFALPVLERIAGIEGERFIPRIRARVMSRIPSRPGIRHYARVKLQKIDGEVWASPIRVSGAGIISSLKDGDGLLVIPEEVEGIEKGSYADVIVIKRYLRW
ncbi:molybdopterin molybdotransferase MoeA [Candidatus Methanodesulfokora washburnensis]|jgi:molybdenum cofactor synthesis domain-containing protein|uniref:Molybdopterin molybdenumtransferase MoeA n=1 Tax=Candidatus Methanodesulfokora washburnensis TaxID=2478471 RepID=A0A3R9PSK9_9CREN|nr:gephyrin-like molybdotransferase Glp [Candidatus Methanodesulfokores washburnensis]RSN71534.1 molybdopterin molybdenumtransferase MoeA [Candidatus Methanodesulfokores washburnensis]